MYVLCVQEGQQAYQGEKGVQNLPQAKVLVLYDDQYCDGGVLGHPNRRNQLIGRTELGRKISQKLYLRQDGLWKLRLYNERHWPGYSDHHVSPLAQEDQQACQGRHPEGNEALWIHGRRGSCLVQNAGRSLEHAQAVSGNISVRYRVQYGLNDKYILTR